MMSKRILVDVAEIFYLFLLGGGEGESEAPGGGGVVENPRRAGGLLGGWGRGGRGAGSVFAGNLGGGLNIVFSGPNFPPRNGGRGYWQFRGAVRSLLATMTENCWSIGYFGCSNGGSRGGGAVEEVSHGCQDLHVHHITGAGDGQHLHCTCCIKRKKEKESVSQQRPSLSGSLNRDRRYYLSDTPV